MSTLRAVRRLKPDPIPTDVLGRVLQAAAWAPTGGNAQPWRIVLVTDPQPKAALGELYSAIVEAVREGLRSALRTSCPRPIARARCARLRPAIISADHFHEAPAIAMFCFNPKFMAITDAKLDRVSVVGGGSIYTAVQNLMLACRAEGLGCVLTTLLCEHEEQGPRNPGDSAAVGHGRCGSDGLSDRDGPRPDPAPAAVERPGLREPLGHGARWA